MLEIKSPLRGFAGLAGRANDAFELTIETSADNETFLLPMRSVSSVDVDWGDGTVDTGITTDDPTHVYATAGTYAISVSGSASGLAFDGSESELKLRTVINFGSLGWSGSFNFGDNFNDCSNMTSFVAGDCDTSDITGMIQFFRDCSSLTSLDLSSLDTSSVTNMGAMFRDCSSLTSLDVTNFDTSSVTDMFRMFLSCSSLTTLDVSNFDTSSVTNMSLMFYNCSSLTSLDVSNFDTSSVTSMSEMFRFCSALTSLDITNFDTSSVTDMGRMFLSCSSLTSLDVTNFDTSSVTDMGGMFRACSSLEDVIGIENFNIESVTVFNISGLGLFTGSGLPTSRYDALLVNWAAQNVNSNLTVDFGNSQYTAGGAAEAARNTLINTYGWVITDGGTAP